MFPFAARGEVTGARNGGLATPPERMVLPPQWSQWRWLLITMSMASGSNPWRAIASGSGSASGGSFMRSRARGVHLIAAAGFDEDGVLAGANQVGVEARGDAVQLVGGDRRLHRVLGTTPKKAPPSHQ